MTRPADNPESLAQVQARIPVEHFRRLDAEASEHDRTLSAEVRRAIRFYVESLPIEQQRDAA